MQYLEIKGGGPLEGEITVQGSKNAALPVLTSCLLGKGPCVIENCPRILDVEDTLAILRQLGCEVCREGSTVSIRGDCAKNYRISGPEATRIRSSVLFLGALLGKMKKAALPWPGGCAIGIRPIDIHLQTLSALGAEFQETVSGGDRTDCGNRPDQESSCEDGSGNVPDPEAEPAAEKQGGPVKEKHIAVYAKRLRGTRIRLPFPSVGATENLILAAVCAEGETVLEHAAREPEIAELCRFLNRRGAAIAMDGNGCIRVKGVQALRPVTWRLCPDRIAAGTWLLASAGTGGRICLNDCPAGELLSLFPLLEQMGGRIRAEGERRLIFTQKQRPLALPRVETAPYPGFPTDLQSVLMASLVRSTGETVICENIFENRFQTAAWLGRMGASVKVGGKTAVIRGVEKLHGAELTAPDLRGGAALAAAALQAEGTTIIGACERIARGYEDLAGTFRSLGAQVRLRGEIR